MMILQDFLFHYAEENVIQLVHYPAPLYSLLGFEFTYWNGRFDEQKYSYKPKYGYNKSW